MLQDPQKKRVTHFDIWVAEHNPDHKLSYGKGWWDFVEIIRRLAYKLEIADVSSASTFVLRTPPPREELLSPVACLRSERGTFYVKEDFGLMVDSWTLSVQTCVDADLRPFLGTQLLDDRALEGFLPGWTFPPYESSIQPFTVRLADELDLYAILRLVS